MGGHRDDELARTATTPVGAASATPGHPGHPADRAGATLGRYHLERELGAGGMGVVHAAFDPDLERRVALKVLRDSATSAEAKDRLLREARAMARLSHPNVITVYEVGTAGGRDFIAMELIHGESLDEWLRAAKRTSAAVIDAFIAAGRGLAAAHAAGMVHRDFKPHNVLRSREGRIVVTDFGLAREVAGQVSVALDMTLPIGATAALKPSTLSGLTVTGALLGTPAYMAPEQWRGAAVTAATDQFAYCVALWEALAGERPYRGPTLDDLRSQVAKGPAALDATRIPRRIRGILCRGLDPDPALRWPTMDALLARLARTQRRPGVILGIAGGALAAAAVAMFAMQGAGAPPAAGCPPPARDPQAVWSPAIRADAAKASAARVAVLDAAYWSWRAARGHACSAPPQVQPAQLQCLDGVLARFDAVRQGYARVPGATAEDVQAQLIDPEICRKPAVTEVPRLAVAANPDVINAYALYAGVEASVNVTPEPSTRTGPLVALASQPTADPCARLIAMLALDEDADNQPRQRTLMNEAPGISDQCGDERLRAELLIALVSYLRERPMIGPKGEAAIRQAELAIHRVTQPDLEALLAFHTISPARQREHWAEALRRADLAVAGFSARGLAIRAASAAFRRDAVRISRSEAGDLEAITADVKRWRPIGEANHRSDVVFGLDLLDGMASFRQGNVASAHAKLLALWQAKAQKRTGPTRKLDGVVVDARGQPVAGARVVSAAWFAADSVGLGLLMSDPDDSLRIETTDAAGRFHMDAAPVGVVAAELADQRSRPAVIADQVRLVLEPTRHVSGRIDLTGIPVPRTGVSCVPTEGLTDRFTNLAPIAADGTFSLAGVSVDAVRISVVTGSGWSGEHVELVTLPASPSSVTGLQLAAPTSRRALDVLVRSAVDMALDGVQVVLLPGNQPVDRLTNVADLQRVQDVGTLYRFAVPAVGEDLAKAVLDQRRSGDLLAHFEHVRAGAVTVCAYTIGGDLADEAPWRRLRDHAEQLALRCAVVGPEASLVMVAVPPQPRLD